MLLRSRRRIVAMIIRLIPTMMWVVAVIETGQQLVVTGTEFNLESEWLLLMLLLCYHLLLLLIGQI